MGLEKAGPNGIASSGVNKETIAKAIQEFLEFPHRPRDHERRSKAYDVTSSIIRIMGDALLRGESIDIPGFGRLAIVTRPAKRAPCYYFYGKEQGEFYEVRRISPRKKVIFTPCDSLPKFLKLSKEPTNG
jgi:nucleoid DNA-binding protein